MKRGWSWFFSYSMNRGCMDEFDILNLWTVYGPVQHDFYLGARGIKTTQSRIVHVLVWYS